LCGAKRRFANRFSKAVTGWLRWKQTDDLTAKPLFTGSSCGLCTDSKWAVQQKNGL
jgi:hypothetical protein